MAAAMVAGSTQAALYSAAAVSNSAGQTQVLRISTQLRYRVPVPYKLRKCRNSQNDSSKTFLRAVTNVSPVSNDIRR